MNPEQFIQNSTLLTSVFGQLPKFHDGEIVSLKLEISSSGFYPKLVLLLSILHFGKRYQIELEFNNVMKNSFENFSNQNSIWEMNFEKLENSILCTIEANCGLSAEIECETVSVNFVKVID
ncbi:hypothetical protein EG359_01100 [Chryseobacterium joostei]|uniref:Immunity protein 50 n=1 Tax=Chryseobacterium joostei TaxID=112234 RepID=A0A1N7IRX6_9FLAO|nr:Imm50 family immunity protein [Chryseobacterium joostei]AZA98283.1 hypothetical protein EG359_01100 [Chryseobacterium joostei]SIS39756.1 Immunity protein 50 [Chryseobacterium joostei]